MARTRRRWLITMVALATAATGLVAIAPSGSAATGAWTIAPYTAPNGTFGLGLQDVSCLSTSWCMAISGEGFAQWDGTSWTYTPTTTAIDTSYDLSSISCTSTSWCVAVGTTFTGIGFDIESWNGTTWSPMTAPALDIRDNYLYDVSCTSPQFCVAVGWAAGGSGQVPLYSNVVEMWYGSAWTLATVPIDPSGQSGLFSVSCTSPSFCMAVGQGSFTLSRGTAMAYTFDGAAWTELTPPTASTLTAVSCLSPTACEVVGQNGAPLIGESWNGSTWTMKTATTPAAGVANWADITCLSATSCYAVGLKGVDTAPAALIEHYSGTTWTLVSNPAGPGLSGVSCVSAAACVAIGSGDIYTNYQPGGAKPSKITAATTSVTEVGGGTVTVTAKITGPAGGGTVSFGFESEVQPIVPICTAVPLTKVGTTYQASCTVAGLSAGVGGANQLYEIEGAYTGSGLYLPAEVGLEGIEVLNPQSGVEQDLGTLPAYKYVNAKVEAAMRDPHCTLGLGTLPTGLTMSPTCALAGTPTAPGADTFVVIMKGTNGSPSHPVTTIDTVHVVVAPLTIAPPSTQEYYVDEAVHLTLTATAGKAPLTWSVSSGSLPPGIVLSTAGAVSGAATVPGTYVATIAVHDSAMPTPQTASTTLTYIVSPMAIVSNEVPNGTVGKLYSSTQLHVNGGKGAYRWSVIAGTVPPGLKFSTAGTLGGTPTAAGTYSFTVQVIDNSKPANTATAVITVSIAG